MFFSAKSNESCWNYSKKTPKIPKPRVFSCESFLVDNLSIDFDFLVNWAIPKCILDFWKPRNSYVVIFRANLVEFRLEKGPSLLGTHCYIWAFPLMRKWCDFLNRK